MPEPLEFFGPEQFEKDLLWLWLHSGDTEEKTRKDIADLHYRHVAHLSKVAKPEMKDITYEIGFDGYDHSRVEVKYGGKSILTASLNNEDISSFKALALAVQSEILKDMLNPVKPCNPPSTS